MKRLVSVGIAALCLCVCARKHHLQPKEINRLAIQEAAEAGAPGSLAFTVALRKSVARLTGNDTLAALPTRKIEREALYRKNQVGGIFGNQNSTMFNGIPVYSVNDKYEEVVAGLDIERNLQCSGIVVTSTRILTAAHCVDVVAWVHEGDGLAGPSLVPVLSGTKFVDADLGLLFLGNGGVSTTTFAQFASTADMDPAKMQTIRPVGYGSNETGIAGTKAFIDAPVAVYHCGASDQALYGCMASGEMVADGSTGDTCEGDSGGPAFVGAPSARRVAAVISRSVKPGRDCLDGSVYVRVDSTAIQNFISQAQPTLFRVRPGEIRR